MGQNRNIYSYLIDAVIILTVCSIVAILLTDYNKKKSVTIDNRIEKYHRDVDPQRDLIYGNPDANIFIVEYGDLECPYCRDIHSHIKKIIEGPQGITGKVAWVWRDGFHINNTSVEKAETLACVRKYAGENERAKAWKFIEESLYGGVLENEYPYDRYKEIIESLDISFERIDTCRKNNEVDDVLQESIKDIIGINVNETPLLHFISGEGDLLFELRGLLTSEELDAFIQGALVNDTQ